MRTIDEVIERGYDLRAWCFRCGRGSEKYAVGVRYGFRERGRSLYLDEAARHFRCTECGRSEDVKLFPCKPLPDGNTTPAQIVGDLFRMMRAESKRGSKRDGPPRA